MKRVMLSNGKMQGHYTLRVEVESMPRKEADALKKNIGWQAQQ